jgi:ferredoxin-NADP reductase/nitrite reductase/ring-hydroxylating ferredoxin subunit
MIPGFDERGWFPVGRSDDAPHRHIHQAKLFGRELAVWRADDDVVNVWTNRCLHRGVRLTVGLNEGFELKCLYHGWRYASRTGGCTYIPAHPADAPAQTIANHTFPVIERHGLIWTSLEGQGAPSETAGLDPDGFDGDASFALRSLPFDAPPELVRGLLDGNAPDGNALDRAYDADDDRVVFFVQPVDRGECVVHSVLAHTPAADDQLAVWHRHALELDRVRDEIETIAAGRPRPEPIVPELERIEPREQGVSMPRARTDADLRVVVVEKQAVAADVVALELAPIDGALPAPQPGAHIDVHLPNGLVRQYSLTNRSGEGSRYVIGVKRESGSRGGSSCIHDTVREGDVLAISAPRNNFTLRRDAIDTLLIAGGIGLTPLLSMAETLHADGHAFTLHLFARSDAHVAFTERLGALGEHVVAHLGRSPDETGRDLADVLADPAADSQVYICGPGPMLDAARAEAARAGWPDDAVHFEYFRNDTEIDDSSSFTISLARSGLTLDVPAGSTILDVLRDHDVAMPSSCEQGACGTCIVGVIEGEPLHQDVYLNSRERARGTRIATCVSRALSDRLILDI